MVCVSRRGLTFHVVGTDVLGIDCHRLHGGHPGFCGLVIEQSFFCRVDVAHHGDHRRRQSVCSLSLSPIIFDRSSGGLRDRRLSRPALELIGRPFRSVERSRGWVTVA